ncbi:WD40-repeat-containing domain protein [Podospora fimiseda]|uniref:WD40-repeat-containing domain protein n=1 Tax=Podospora fimiseda TaxID=252190 RepID=A0AAN7BVW8_9PEZI|nr:WD40-repeat-containing domain protein [Podospora fimiseda]
MSRRRQQEQQPEDSSDEGSFADFDQNDQDVSMSDSDNDSSSIPRKDAALLDKDSDEEDLERLVLGSKVTWRDQLFRDDFLPDVSDSKALVPAAAAAKDDHDQATRKALDDSMLFAIDTGKPTDGPLFQETAAEVTSAEPQDAPAWEDSDDERLTVSLATASRLRKLRTFEGEDVVNGVEYSQRLRQQYLRLYPLPEWAAPPGAKRRRRSSAADDDLSSDSELENSDGEEIESALPLDAFLRSAASFAPTDSSNKKRRKLRPETLDIQRTRDIPDSHKSGGGVSSLAFHPSRPILLSTSVSSIMYLHSIDPAAHPTPNPLLTSVQVKRTDLRRAAFVGPEGEEIVFAGRRRYFHSWNLSSGDVKKVTKVQGHQKEHRTMERFRVSPDGKYMAIAASDKKGGGMLNIVNVDTMQWIAQARLDSRHGIADFGWWSDGNGLTIAGKDGSVAEWSLITKRTVGIWRDEGSIGGTVMVLGGRNGPAELGGHRWVAMGNTSGVLNVYDRNELVEKKGKEVQVKKLPTPARSFEQLTTAISVAEFSPDGQLLAFGSVLKKDAMRLVHLPSCTVYRNWPTEQTPLGRVTAVAFSAGSDVLAVGNDAGKIRLWEIRG